MQHDYHVLYTQYLERITAGFISGCTRAEATDARVWAAIREDALTHASEAEAERQALEYYDMQALNAAALKAVKASHPVSQDAGRRTKPQPTSLKALKSQTPARLRAAAGG